MATKEQILALYMRFFPGARFAHIIECTQTAELFNDKKRPFNNNSNSCLSALAGLFAEAVPEDEFSTAELQGYLLMCKMKPLEAVSGIAEWVEQGRTEKRTREEREARQKQKVRESRMKAKIAMMADLIEPLEQ
jgi:mitochondrial chaperone BCS1